MGHRKFPILASAIRDDQKMGGTGRGFFLGGQKFFSSSQIFNKKCSSYDVPNM